MKRALLFVVLLPIFRLYPDDTQTIRQEVCSWHSWSGIGCKPSRIFYPTSVDHVRDIIKDAAQKKLSVRFVGSGHSLNELVCTDGYLVNTDHFDKVLGVDKEACTVRVQGGIKLKHLFRYLARYHNLALENQGFIKEQSIAGALATGTHGTGKTGTLSDFIKSVELIDGNGEYRIIAADTNSEWLAAARLNLGSLGFVYAVTLQCVPLFVLTHQRELKMWGEVLEYFDEYYNNNDYLMFMAHPVSDKVLVYRWNKTDKEPTNNFFIRLSERLFMNEVANYLTIKAAYYAPGITNEFINFFFKGLQQEEHRALSYKTLSPIKSPHEVEDYIEEEIAIPMKYFTAAVQDVVSLYQRYKKDGFELVGFMTCRFVKGSQKALLSPAYAQDCAYISLVTLNRFAQWKEFYQEFEQLMERYSVARPHWAKFNSLTKEKVAHLWGANVEQFNVVRAQLDPNNLFGNEYLCARI